MMPTTFMEPEVPNNPNESRLSLGPGAAQSITNHFPMRSNKNDHQLVWQFEEKEITLRCLESAIDSRGCITH
jgi:cell cycle checkpoint control protein RAD9A